MDGHVSPLLFVLGVTLGVALAAGNPHQAALYETVIHRLDLATTNGQPLDVSSEIAAEGVDEWLENLRAVVQVPVATIATDQRTVSLAADDTGDAWRVLLSPHGWRWDRDASHGDVHVTGLAKELLLLLQGRGAGATRAEGEQVLLEVWRDATLRFWC